MKTLHEQIKAVRRELSMRIAVYPRRVESGKMTQEQAEHEIDCMRSVLAVLEAVNPEQQKQLPMF